jgi:hypothetical protein
MEGVARRGLRFDKVALRLIARLQSTLARDVPDGMTLLVTISAPIRLPSKTVVDIGDRIRAWLASGAVPPEFRAGFNGNQVRIRIVNGTSETSPGVFVFVHNPDVDTTSLFNEVQASLTAR